MSDQQTDMTNISTREDLAALLEGRSDAQIVEEVTAIGTATVLSQIAAAMVDRFDGTRAHGQAAVIQWDIDAPDGQHAFHLDVASGSCTAGTGPGTAPRVTLALSLVDFLRLIAGDAEGPSLFMAGRLRVTGDLMFAQTMQGWFAI
jgi:putative sterol carrier protein